MKLVVNYDLIDSIKNVNEPLNPFKVIRNNKRVWAKFNLPVYTMFDFCFTRDLKSVLEMLLIQFSALTIAEQVTLSLIKVDKYKDKSEYDLKKLVSRLNDINVDTNYELLKESVLDSKKYNIRLNDNKIPEFFESKYILVPSFTYNGDIKDKCVLQEHKVGSSDYYLSLETPIKKKSLALAKSNI